MIKAGPKPKPIQVLRAKKLFACVTVEEAYAFQALARSRGMSQSALIRQAVIGLILESQKGR